MRRPWLAPRIGLCIGSALLSAGCADDEPAEGWAIVKVEIAADIEPLQSICFGDAGCRVYERRTAVRLADFAAWVNDGTRFEVSTFGSDGGGSGPAPIAGCVLVKIHSQGTSLDECDVRDATT